MDKAARLARLHELDDQRRLASLSWSVVCERAAVPYSTVFRCLRKGQAPNASTLESIRAALEELVNERRANLERITTHGP